MTDYIARLLLAQREQTREGQETDIWGELWAEIALPVPQADEDQGEGERPAPAIQSMQTAFAGGAAEFGDGEMADSGGADSRGSDILAGVRTAGLEEEGGTAGKTAAAEWAYQALRRSLWEPPAPRRETRVVSLQRPGDGSGGERWDAGTLDRLVRRDARRFDGGFQLL
ncbi:hypothetical protein [uncultured Flavonifractor sp.]|uniref:hypothetical protein n=1 Tax=uncultured Flavonifractor sp. TaxID=1193534 RepID=UPI0026356BA4|nr:hypothetical protein [uncultured Flavonifractor sp.]